MEDQYHNILNKSILRILNEIPIACDLLVDTKGNWNIRDIKKVWANNAADILFGGPSLGFLANRIALSKANSLQASIDQVRQAEKNGETGFIGPFSNPYLKPDSSLLYIEYHFLFLGRTENGHPAFFSVIFDKTEEIYHRKIRQAVGADSDSSAWEMLSVREKHIAELICQGTITKEIAENLCISERTIDNHRANIRKKLNIPRTTTIAEYLGRPPSQ